MGHANEPTHTTGHTNNTTSLLLTSQVIQIRKAAVYICIPGLIIPGQLGPIRRVLVADFTIIMKMCEL